MRCADFYMSGYNVVFTMLPPLLVGILDQDVDRAHISKFPGERSMRCCPALSALQQLRR